jgi:ferric-dicitrate binding protein FerR (iron transport regulator)
VLDWKNGKLIFENTTLEDAFAKLQSRYDCRIILENKQLAKRKVTGSFNANEPLDHVLATLQYVHGFSYTKTGSRIYVIDGNH